MVPRNLKAAVEVTLSTDATGADADPQDPLRQGAHQNRWAMSEDDGGIPMVKHRPSSQVPPDEMRERKGRAETTEKWLSFLSLEKKMFFTTKQKWGIKFYFCTSQFVTKQFSYCKWKDLQALLKTQLLISSRPKTCSFQGRENEVKEKKCLLSIKQESNPNW